MPSCPPSEQQVASAVYDYGIDIPGGPATPEAALHELVVHAFPRLARADFVRSDVGGGATFTYTDDARGQMILRFENYGDSWSLSSSSACAALETWARRGQ